MNKAVKIGARPSPLALKQAQEVRARLPKIKIKVVAIQTMGDKDKVSPLSGSEGSDLFTREIENSLLEGRIDAAVHSAKDLEEGIPQGLIIAALTKSLSPFECLVSRDNLTLEGLPAAARIGTSSRKRKEAIRRFRSDLIVRDIRGNIDERLAQLDSGKFDAIIVAHAALIRLGLEKRIAQIIAKEIIEPHPLQGRLAIQVRRDSQDLLKLFGGLDGR